MPQRGDRVSRPTRVGEWTLRFDDKSAGELWERLVVTHAGPLGEAFDQLATAPRHQSKRQARLRADLATRSMKGRDLEQWQYELSGAGRIWYCIDDDARTVWITLVTSGHPSATDTTKRRKRG